MWSRWLSVFPVHVEHWVSLTLSSNLTFYFLLQLVQWWSLLSFVFDLLVFNTSPFFFKISVFFLCFSSVLFSHHIADFLSPFFLTLSLVLTFLSSLKLNLPACLYSDISPTFLVVNFWNFPLVYTHFSIFGFSSWLLVIFWRHQVALLSLFAVSFPLIPNSLCIPHSYHFECLLWFYLRISSWSSHSGGLVPLCQWRGSKHC